MSDMSSAKASSSSRAADLSALSFEDALAELERIVRGLEGGQQRLEDAITAYERGSALRQHCEAKLREAEMRVERIVAQGNAPGAGGAAAGQETNVSARTNTGASPGANLGPGRGPDLDEEIPF